jgi:Fe-S oxidoreductase
MLSLPERAAFLVLVLICAGLAYQGFSRFIGLIRQGKSAARGDRLVARFTRAAIDVALQKPIFKARPVVSLLHGFIFFGFSFYLLVNVNDVLEAFVPGWTLIGRGGLAGAFNLFSDLFSVLVLIGMVALLFRRFGQQPKVLTFNPSVKLHAAVAAGAVKRDSAIVGVFILLHVGSRWVGTALHLAERGEGDPWMPTASLLRPLFASLSPAALETGIHVCWWLAMGLIVLFLPYFPRSKHLHLMVAPVNLALGRTAPGDTPQRGALDATADASQPGAKVLSDLPWPQLLDSYACIMCNRCQEVCPAHSSGTPLSPAALEINKRYHLNDPQNGTDAALLDIATTVDAVWSCTTCYACIEVCPVGNEPMMDLIDLRRSLIFDGEAPDELAEVLRSLDEKGNSFGESARKRARWAKPLDFKIPDAKKQACEYLWFVGDFASYNPDCQETSRKVATIFHAAGIDFATLASDERSAGNDVRRTGEEGLFEALAEHNIAKLEACDFQKIVTTDPHTFNALKNEYGPLGGRYEVEHYSTLLLELLQAGKLPLEKKLNGRATYHDPCYLGRYNGGFDAPREVIEACGVEIVEMPRNRENSFCCGAGGGRIWMKDHDDVTERPSENRIREALGLGNLDYFVVSCPKDMTMYSDAVKTSGNEGKIEVRDIADFVAEAMGL